MSLSLFGYVTNVNDTTFTLTGVDRKKWDKLDASYWGVDVHRRVSKNKKTCVVRVNSKTLFSKNGKDCLCVDMNGCYVNVIAYAKKYAFVSEGAGVHGWCIVAQCARSVKIPGT